ncbi:Phosphatidylinositol 4-kinase beta [Conglomerata obtusa]
MQNNERKLWLHRLFNSDCFDTWVIVSYLYRYTSPGIHFYLLTKLRCKSRAEIIMVLPHLVHICSVVRSAPMHRFLCEQGIECYFLVRDNVEICEEIVNRYRRRNRHLRIKAGVYKLQEINQNDLEPCMCAKQEDISKNNNKLYIELKNVDNLHTSLNELDGKPESLSSKSYENNNKRTCLCNSANTNHNNTSNNDDTKNSNFENIVKFDKNQNYFGNSVCLLNNFSKSLSYKTFPCPIIPSTNKKTINLQGILLHITKTIVLLFDQNLSEKLETYEECFKKKKFIKSNKNKGDLFLGNLFSSKNYILPSIYFMDELVNISKRLKYLPKNIRQKGLEIEIGMLNYNLPSDVFLVINKDKRVFNVVGEFSYVLDSAENSPFFVVFEIAYRNERTSKLYDKENLVVDETVGDCSKNIKNLIDNDNMKYNHYIGKNISNDRKTEKKNNFLTDDKNTHYTSHKNSNVNNKHLQLKHKDNVLEEKAVIIELKSQKKNDKNKFYSKFKKGKKKKQPYNDKKNSIDYKKADVLQYLNTLNYKVKEDVEKSNKDQNILYEDNNILGKNKNGFFLYDVFNNKCEKDILQIDDRNINNSDNHSMLKNDSVMKKYNVSNTTDNMNDVKRETVVHKMNFNTEPINKHHITIVNTHCDNSETTASLNSDIFDNITSADNNNTSRNDNFENNVMIEDKINTANIILEKADNIIKDETIKEYVSSNLNEDLSLKLQTNLHVVKKDSNRKDEILNNESKIIIPKAINSFLKNKTCTEISLEEKTRSSQTLTTEQDPKNTNVENEMSYTQSGNHHELKTKNKNLEHADVKTVENKNSCQIDKLLSQTCVTRSQSNTHTSEDCKFDNEIAYSTTQADNLCKLNISSDLNDNILIKLVDFDISNQNNFSGLEKNTKVKCLNRSNDSFNKSLKMKGSISSPKTIIKHKITNTNELCPLSTDQNTNNFAENHDLASNIKNIPIKNSTKATLIVNNISDQNGTKNCFSKGDENLHEFTPNNLIPEKCIDGHKNIAITQVKSDRDNKTIGNEQTNNIYLYNKISKTEEKNIVIDPNQLNATEKDEDNNGIKKISINEKFVDSSNDKKLTDKDFHDHTNVENIKTIGNKSDCIEYKQVIFCNQTSKMISEYTQNDTIDKYSSKLETIDMNLKIDKDDLSNYDIVSNDNLEISNPLDIFNDVGSEGPCTDKTKKIDFSSESICVSDYIPKMVKNLTKFIPLSVTNESFSGNKPSENENSHNSESNNKNINKDDKNEDNNLNIHNEIDNENSSKMLKLKGENNIDDTINNCSIDNTEGNTNIRNDNPNLNKTYYSCDNPDKINTNIIYSTCSENDKDNNINSIYDNTEIKKSINNHLIYKNGAFLLHQLYDLQKNNVANNTEVNAIKENVLNKIEGISTKNNNHLLLTWEEKMKLIKERSKYKDLIGYEIVSAIIKRGNDLRQEILALQLLSEMKRIFKEEDLNIYLNCYKIILIDEKSAFIEAINNVESIHNIKKRDKSIKEHFKKYHKSEKAFCTAIVNFTTSLVGYSLATYFLQIKDRHNGNILIDKEGHLIHVDFGFILGNHPGFYNVERAPFKFSTEYSEVLDDNLFKSLFLEGFLALRKNSDRLCRILEILAEKNKIKYINISTLNTFRERFRMDLGDREIEKWVSGLINWSLNSIGTGLYDSYQYFSNGYMK